LHKKELLGTKDGLGHGSNHASERLRKRALKDIPHLKVHEQNFE